MNKINTNTHLLSSIEKPDSSYYLIHLTDKDSLTSILKSNKLNHGIIFSKRGRISFTETPLHSLGFFRRRWPEYKGGKNIKYGIGFMKQFLIDMGVKQAIYLQKEMIKLVKESLLKVDSLNKAQRDELAIRYGLNINNIEQILDELRERSTDNGEIYSKGGFTWEREWILNINDSQGFEFDYKSIGLICCPKEEQEYFWEIVKNVYPMSLDSERSLNIKWYRQMRFIDVDHTYKQTISMLRNLDDYEVNYKRFSCVLTIESFRLMKEKYSPQIAMEKIRDIILLSDLKEDNFVDELLLRRIILESFNESLIFLKEFSFSLEENHKHIYKRYEFINMYDLFKLIILDRNNLRYNIIMSLVAFLLTGEFYDCLDYMLYESKINHNKFINNFMCICDYRIDWKDEFWKYLYDIETVIKENLFDYLVNSGVEEK